MTDPAGRRPGVALVLGGGGVAGIAWEHGVLRGLEEAGAALSADVVFGTSAGSVVGARILGDPDLERWYRHETRPVEPAEEALIRQLGGRVGGLAFRASRRRGLGWLPNGWILARSLEAEVRRRARPPRPLAAWPETRAGVRRILPPSAALARLGTIARVARTASEEDFLETVDGLLRHATTWPERLVTTIVDTGDGASYALDHRAGVPLVRGVGASAAVPILFPTVELLGRRMMDGGMSSVVHVGLGADAERILVLAPLVTRGLAEEADAVRAQGVRVDVVTPGPAARTILGFGLALLDPGRRLAAALAGREDGLRAAAAIRAPSAPTTAPATPATPAAEPRGIA